MILSVEDERRIAQIFHAYDEEGKGQVPLQDIIDEILDQGFQIHKDQRFRQLSERYPDREATRDVHLAVDEFKELFTLDCGQLIKKTLQGHLTVPDFPFLKDTMKEIFENAEENEEGEVATYIPQLAEVSPELYGVAVCTVDGQQMGLGDSEADFCLQSCSKALSYCVALEENGVDVCHNHLGREPSGVGFNKMVLNDLGRPHNPMINSGAIMVCSLIMRKLPLYQ